MPETQIKTYKRLTQKKEKQKPSSKAGLIFRLLGFFCGGASVYFGVAPFGLSFMTLERRLTPKALLCALAVFSGSLLIGDKLMSARYALSTFLYILSLFVLERGVSLSKKASAIVMCCSLFAVSMGINFIHGYTIENTITLLYELCGIFLGSFAMSECKSLLVSKRLFSRNLTPIEKISILFCGTILFLSLKNFNIIKDFALSNIIASFLILVSARSCGIAVSSVVGLTLGMLSGMGTDYFLPFMGAFAFCAAGTGLVAKKGKIWAAIALIISNSIVIVYVNGAIRNMLSVYEIIGACALFYAIPDKVYHRFGRLFKIKNSDAELIKRIKGSLILRLKSVSASFSSLGDTLSHLSEKENAPNLEDIATVFDKTSDKVCRRCHKANLCWGKNFNSSYKAFFRLLEAIDSKGALSDAEANALMGSKCAKAPKITAELINQYNMYRLNLSWKKRLCENREAVSQQISGVSKIINELAREINEDINYDSMAASEIRLRTESRGIKVYGINAMKDRDGKSRIEMSIRSSDWTPRGRSVIRAVTENVTGKEVNIYQIKKDGDLTMIMIDEKEQYEVEQGFASIGACEESGDNFKCITPGGGKFVITLSDGMGTGERASKESLAIIELLDSFLKAGFDKHIAVRLINSIMVLKSTNESFATLDMCIIDLHTGEVEFIKTGAEPSFIKQGNHVETVRASSLPVGLLPDMEVETFARHLNDGDTIVMVTDGVETKDSGSKWIKSFIENTKSDSANELAARLLDRAVKNTKGSVCDDMTVVSLKIRKKSA